MAAPRAVAAPVRVQSLMGMRMYSAGGSLNKEEVEGRILSLLQGFDKVGASCSLSLSSVISASYGSKA
jgi:NADH dehydrogenase (ubiquinone) 1 alpha/beta subcomplex 1